MRGSQRDAKGSGSFALPVLTIVALLGSYLLLSQWQDLPHLINTTFAAVRWPIPG